MANNLYIWSNIPGQWFKASTETDASKKSADDSKAGNKVLVAEVKSLDDLGNLFTRLANQSDVWNSVSFYTHGAGGSVALGATSLTSKTLQVLENRNLERIFAKDCAITFEGCSVAEDAEGEFFLIQVGETFVSTEGGKVRGNTGSGFGYWGGESSAHPFGEWVVANVGAGGSLRLENGNFLHLDHIRDRLKAAERKLADFKDWPPGNDKRLIEEWVQNVKNWGTTGWNARLQSCLWLDKIEAQFSLVEMQRARGMRGH